VGDEMNFIDFDHEKCDECFKCLRVCPTKAIAFTNHSRHIINDLCIKCGRCQKECPQGALTIHLDLQGVQHAVQTGKTVIASIAPSFAGAFDLDAPGKMCAALKKLGFSAVEETARGAEMVSIEYEKYISKSNLPNIITSCCPSSNYLIEHYYENVIDSVIPVVSPMLAHGFDIHARYGSDVFVVFIGPCLAKKAEALEIENSIDAVITFKELESWFHTAGISLQNMVPIPFDTPSSKRGRAYPLGGSLWRKDLKTRISPHYKYIHIDGVAACQEFLSAVNAGEITGYCAELNICEGSCVNGPDMPSCAPNRYRRVQAVTQNVETPRNDQRDPGYHRLPVEVLKRTFEPLRTNIPEISDFQVAEILITMGKYSKQDQLNCGACGYSTCHDKAVAIAHGFSDINMCIDTLRKKAESLQSVIVDNSPNAICILDSEQRIQSVNPSFNHLFNASKIKLDYWPIQALIEDTIFEDLSRSSRQLISKKIYLDSIDRTFFCNVVKLENGKNYVGILTDITEAENSRRELDRVKAETMVTCQHVIEKQMRVAQEIASLLGETTAETKVGLNKLKTLVLTDGGDTP
jgi:iron only hydrogenase large subunit-like protein